ncbi:MAG TPA: 2-polyprenyl-3-methyl-6-methoxy-1,4-benzoquinone monooxygenase [Methylibium sp.]|nr:2-polyprenyl-3-methyl-6-methoxy-1,4-benzoquinone monooxygenase [Methylibium sp.]
MRTLSPADHWIGALDGALRTLAGRHVASRPLPQAPSEARTTPLDPLDRTEAAALMRVNHVGEVCAQALYQAQALGTRDARLRAHFEAASRDETDHLAWTEARLDALGGRRSHLNPLWYAGSFVIGLLAARRGDAASLGFVVETERQVEQHLAGHLERLPAADVESRAVVTQMAADEARHAFEAEQAGAAPVPAPVRWLMRAAARLMTATAHHI